MKTDKMTLLKKGDHVGIVCCSNGQKQSQKPKIELLAQTLCSLGIEPVFSPYIYEREGAASGTAKERAAALMEFYRDDSIKAIFDISGGDLANEILPYLDYGVIAGSGKLFWGYSDLTTVINAVYTKTGKASVLYQVRNLIYDYAEMQKKNFAATVFGENETLPDFSYEFYQGKEMRGIAVGGNVRCLLKLAGTEYFPDVTGKILLLEAYSGSAVQLSAYFSQLQQMGVFKRAAGILLGTFTEMERQHTKQEIVSILKRFTDDRIAIAGTAQIGHGTDAKGIMIGKEIFLHR